MSINKTLEKARNLTVRVGDIRKCSNIIDHLGDEYQVIEINHANDKCIIHIIDITYGLKYERSWKLKAVGQDQLIKRVSK